MRHQLGCTRFAAGGAWQREDRTALLMLVPGRVVGSSATTRGRSPLLRVATDIEPRDEGRARA
jgi:hypothetical protein